MEVALQQLINGLQVGTVYALIAVGYTLVYGVLKLINFAHGDVYMLGAYVGYVAGTYWGLPFLPALVAAAALSALAGIAIERIAYRPLRNAPRLSALITAVSVSLALENGTRAVAGATYRPFPQLIPQSVISVGGLYLTNVILVVLATALIVMLALTYLVQRTIVGKAIRAVSVDPEAAQLMGIPLDRIIPYTFAVGSACAGIAGVMVGMVWPMVDPYMGLVPGIKAFTAAVIGGIGSVPGALVGGYLLGLVETVAAGFMASSYRDAIAFGVLIAMLLLRPTGLFGRPQVEKL